ncbi:MAG TPA: CHAD domain-containing protein [Candidatus Kapabacteria bacterium]|nr:CHAD domain-containing protein [Candidatus Kapabacteria bacterium]
MDALLNYYDSERLKYRNYLRLASKQPTPEVVHELRLTIKKIRALYYLAEFEHQSFDRTKQFAFYRSIFRKAGKVRDLDIIIELIENHNGNRRLDLRSLLPFLRAKRQQEMVQLRSYSNPSNDQTDSVIRRIIAKEISKNDLEDFLDRIRNKLRSTQKKHLSQKRLHKMRKLYKMFGYIIDASKINWNHKSLKRLRKRQQVLGQWHDFSRAVTILTELDGSSEIRKIFRKQEQQYRQKAIKQARKSVL